jgi:hypothetical protein
MIDKKTLHILCVHKWEQQIDVNDHQQISLMQIKGILIMANCKWLILAFIELFKTRNYANKKLQQTFTLDVKWQDKKKTIATNTINFQHLPLSKHKLQHWLTKLQVKQKPKNWTNVYFEYQMIRKTNPNVTTNEINTIQLSLWQHKHQIGTLTNYKTPS